MSIAADLYNNNSLTEQVFGKAITPIVEREEFSLEKYLSILQALWRNNDTNMNQSAAISPGDDTMDEFIDYGCMSFDKSDHNVLVSHKVTLAFTITCIVIGLVGNTLSALVFSSKEMRNVTMNFYLLLLALSDSMYLLSAFLTHGLMGLRCLYYPEGRIDIYNRSTIMCKGLQYCLDLFADYSTCLILAFTVERFIIIHLPMKSRMLCTVKKAKMVCVIFAIVIASIIAPYHFMYIGRYQGYNVCSILPDYEHEFSILYITETVIFRILPIIGICLLNIAMVLRLKKIHQDSSSPHEEEIFNGAPTQCEKVIMEKHTQVTIMLIVVSSVYVVVFFPVLLHFMLIWMERSGMIQLPKTLQKLFHMYSTTLYILGFSLNFFLYAFSARSFRDQVKKMLHSHRQPCGKTDPKYITCDSQEIETVI